MLLSSVFSLSRFAIVGSSLNRNLFWLLAIPLSIAPRRLHSCALMQESMSPYSPDLNPIEEFFSELKAFFKRSKCYEEVPGQSFNEWRVNVVLQEAKVPRVISVMQG